MRRIHRWWRKRSEEEFWLEVTGRTDLGTDLRAPQKNETGGEFWSYSLVHEVSHGDLVFHYDRPSRQIKGVSRATGDHWKDRIVWGARGTHARKAGIAPHGRPGIYAGLAGFENLIRPVSLEQIRAKTAVIQSELNELRQTAGDPLYFPFERGEKRPIRPLQGYLFRLPHFFVKLFPQLWNSSGQHHIGAMMVREEIGSEYRPANETLSVGTLDPLDVDPALIERGTRGHAITQNSLAHHLEARGLSPRSPAPHEPNFDLAWQDDDRLFVAEIKSVTDRNEERQLRLGLGQVLQYRHQLKMAYGCVVVGVLVMEREPPSEWLELCGSLSVLMAWPGCLDRVDN